MAQQDGFYIKRPQRPTIPFVFNAPHSGNQYSEDFLAQSAVSLAMLRQQEDFEIDLLFSAAPHFGATLMAAQFPRSFVDVNREPYELDPKMFTTALPPYVNSSSSRVRGGIGTIARQCANGREIYSDRLAWPDALKRIENFYFPYHTQLKTLLSETYKKFDHVILVDCHSMPAKDAQADIVIGDCFGCSAAGGVSNYIVEIFTALGYRVARNQPYAGGFITAHYGKPEENYHTLQIEINRSLYMDETTLKRSQEWESLAKNISHFMEKLVQCDWKPLLEKSCPTKV